ncbi:MAG: SLC13 family permease, partial [Byssovorax sp.]
MLTFLGFAMILTFMFLIMSKRLTALVALTLVPICFAVLASVLGAVGGGKTFPALGSVKLAALGPMMLDGIRTLAPTGVLLMFAILYFALMIDSGLFDPAVRWILRLVKGDPLKVTMGTVLLTLVVSLDGDGSTTYMIGVAALHPLFKRL